MYVDAYYSKEDNEIWVVERHNGKRHYVTYPVEYVTYYDDPNGRYKTIFGNRVSKFSTTSYKEYQKELKLLNNKTQYESDINPIFKVLEENYKGLPSPELHIAFFDIEVDFNPERGFAPVEDPFSPITAVSVYMSWIGKNITLCLYPNNLTRTEAEELLDGLEDTFIFDDEKELLETFLELIEDSDIILGWNSTKFDIPYIVRRIELVLSKEHTRKMCLWDLLPKKKHFTQFKKEYVTYELFGRVHVDYLDLYRKHSMQELHTYKLDYVGEIEIGENKIPYEGTLDDLWKKDYKKFVEYNKQDVMILVKIEKKKKFINLANQLAHTNTVLIPTTMGSVALIEQAIINEAHNQGLIVPNKKSTDDKINDVEIDEDDNDEDLGDAVAGAYVVDPKTGIHDWVGSVDINSLYPSTIRTFNMGPETLIAQLRPNLTEEHLKRKVAEENISMTAALHDLFGTLEYQEVIKRSDVKLWIDFEQPTQESFELTAKEIYDLIFDENSGWCITANGTIFKTDKPAIIPKLLGDWYADRKTIQGKSRDLAKAADAAETEEEKIKLKEESDYWDTQQYLRKILLNSLYGALLNPFCRFFDKRVGQSVTLTGRCITKHMSSKINEILTGDYNHTGDAIVYGDTDSSYFSIGYAISVNENLKELYKDFEITKESIVELYDSVAEEANASFNGFLTSDFNVNTDYAVIKAGREIVASKSLFIKKKRYAALVYDKEGIRKDKDNKPGEVKAMGLDLKRSDTPKYVQQFLENILELVLTGSTEKEVIEKIKKFKTEFREKPSWEKGTPKKVNALTDYTNKYNMSRNPEELMDLQSKLLRVKTKKEKNLIKKEIEKAKRVTIPGHVMASIEYNRLRKINNDNYSMPILDGSKIIVCKLRKNPMKINSVAYPIDENNLPQWFKTLPFDDDLMEETIVDKKVVNLLSVLGWNLSMADNSTTFNDLFTL